MAMLPEAPRLHSLRRPPDRCRGSLLWRDLKFLTIAAGMALGLFAQIGLIVHLFSLLVPALGAYASRAGDGTDHRHGHYRPLR